MMAVETRKNCSRACGDRIGVMIEQKVGDEKRQDDGGVGGDDDPRGPHEEQAGSDDGERQTGVVRRGKPPHEHRHHADTKRDQHHERGRERVWKPIEELAANDAKHGERDEGDDGASRVQEPEPLGRGDEVVENSEKGIERNDDPQRASGAASIAL
jgi:hypothetical protein